MQQRGRQTGRRQGARGTFGTGGQGQRDGGEAKHSFTYIHRGSVSIYLLALHIADANVLDRVINLPNPVPEATVQPGSLSYRAGESPLEHDISFQGVVALLTHF